MVRQDTLKAGRKGIIHIPNGDDLFIRRKYSKGFSTGTTGVRISCRTQESMPVHQRDAEVVPGHRETYKMEETWGQPPCLTLHWENRVPHRTFELKQEAYSWMY